MIYFDYNATTPPGKAVIDAMHHAMQDFYNPSGSYHPARKSARLISDARKAVAHLIGTEAGHIIFTSGGTESINTATYGLTRSAKKPRIITQPTEHAATLKACESMAANGVEIDMLKIDRSGLWDPAELEQQLEKPASLVSLMAANNETGVCYPVETAAKICSTHHTPLHIDAVQAVGKTTFKVTPGMTAVSLSAHKLFGPRGCGALFIAEGAPFSPLIRGGSQENGRRAGTENTPAIAGFGVAAIDAMTLPDEYARRVEPLRDRLEAELTASIPDLMIAGRNAPRLPNTTQMILPGIPSDAALARLDMENICCSSGSACAAGAPEPSHVLKAMGFSHDEASRALRLSLGPANTIDEVYETVKAILNIIGA